MITLFEDELLSMRDKADHVGSVEDFDSDYMIGVFQGMKWAFEYLVTKELPPEVSQYLQDIPEGG